MSSIVEGGEDENEVGSGASALDILAVDQA